MRNVRDRKRTLLQMMHDFCALQEDHELLELKALWVEANGNTCGEKSSQPALTFWEHVSLTLGKFN